MSLIVGTAGHIDHGKTTLVRMLTGVDLDALPEERDRGITIALGFCSLALPDGRNAAFVDVPGHERLIRTMVAGATGIDAVILCVSAVDGVMPQTREHLAILELLGVSSGAVALTMVDLVDEEMVELAAEDVAETVSGTFLQGAPVVPVNGLTGQGKQALIDVIQGFPDGERVPDGPFRLPVDRAFIRDGFGTVVTGTTWSGTVRDGDTVSLLPGSQQCRVRGIQVHGEVCGSAQAGQRTALNLSGVETAAVPRGTVICGQDVPTPSMVDVRYHHLAGSPPLEDDASVRVLLGTTERLGRLHFAEDREELGPGRRSYAQLRLEAPLPCLPGDRFIIRRTSPMDTLGGGEVLDPWAPRMRRKQRVAWGRQLERLDDGDSTVWLERAGEEGLSLDEWMRRDEGDRTVIVLGDRVFAPSVAGRLQGVLLEALATFHNEHPLALGAHRRELKRGRLGHLADRVFDALVDRLADARTVLLDGPMVRVAGFEVALTSDQLALDKRIRNTIAQAGVGGIFPKALHVAHPEPEVASLMRLLESGGFARQIVGLGWVAESSLQNLRGTLQDHFSTADELATGDFKELTGLSRKGAIPLLEWLDSERWTVRDGDVRRVGRQLR